MPRSFEELLGQVEREPVLPGTRPGESDKVRYVEFKKPERPADSFDAVVGQISPPLVNRGGVVLENWVITVPEGPSFYPVAYHSDLAGWTRQIEEGAAELGRLTAKIEADALLIADGRSYPIAQCAIERELHTTGKD